DRLEVAADLRVLVVREAVGDGRRHQAASGESSRSGWAAPTRARATRQAARSLAPREALNSTSTGQASAANSRSASARSRIASTSDSLALRAGSGRSLRAFAYSTFALATSSAPACLSSALDLVGGIV